jgi:predicted dehydrogenase
MVRVGILSAAHVHTDAYAAPLRALPGVDVAGLWDDVPERLAVKSAQYAVDAFSELDALLARCDAVVICAENIRHRPLAEAAAAAGCHVLSEKPLATVPDDAAAMVAACDRAGVGLYTAFPCRFAPAFVHLQGLVAAGEIGDILAVRATNQGKCPGGWFIDKALSGGGAVMDHTVHVTDLLRLLLADEIESVFCEADNGLLHGDFDDTGFLTLNFERGVFATLDASWSRPKTFPTWGNVTMGVIGSRGLIEMDMFGQESVLVSDRTGAVSYQNWGSDIDRGMIHAFVAAVRGEDPGQLATGIDGQRAVEVVAAAYASASTHQIARVDRL